jgi:hypothetical protein
MGMHEFLVLASLSLATVVQVFLRRSSFGRSEM